MTTPTDDPIAWREAVEWHAARVPVAPEVWAALSEAARQRAFTVTGLARVALVADVHAAIERALTSGTTLREFRRDVGAMLEAQWGRKNAGRVETIFRTNVQAAYNAARYQELSSDVVKKVRPYWKFVAILDPRTTDTCRPLDNTILPADHEFWRTHWPPLHFSCRSIVVSLSHRQTARAGGVTAVPTGDHIHPPLAGFGGTPDLAGDSLRAQ